MTKKELVTEIADVANVTKVAAEKVLNALTDSIKGTLAKKESVTLVGLGTFSVSNRKARKGRNPQTGEEINIAACSVPKFKAGKSLKDAVK